MRAALSIAYVSQSVCLSVCRSGVLGITSKQLQQKLINKEALMAHCYSLKNATGMQNVYSDVCKFQQLQLNIYVSDPNTATHLILVHRRTQTDT